MPQKPATKEERSLIFEAFMSTVRDQDHPSVQGKSIRAIARKLNQRIDPADQLTNTRALRALSSLTGSSDPARRKLARHRSRLLGWTTVALQDQRVG